MDVSLEALSWRSGMERIACIFSFISCLFRDRVRKAPAEQHQDQQWALNEMAKWLSHSKEFGKKPVEQQIVYERAVSWPWQKDPVKIFLIKYKMRNGVEGIGFTGPITWSFVGIKDWQALTPEDWVCCYAGWYIQFFFTHSKDFLQKDNIERANQFVTKLIKQGMLYPNSYKVCDVLELGGNFTYYAIETIKDGKLVYLVGTENNYIFYNKDLPQMQFPPLFYFLGRTFNPFKDA